MQVADRGIRILGTVAVAMALATGCRRAPSMAPVGRPGSVPPAVPSPEGTGPSPVSPSTPQPAATPFVQRPSGQTSTVGTLAGGAPASDVFSEPDGLAAWASGSLAVADHGSLTLWTVSATGQVSKLAGGTFGRQDGTGSAAQFWGLSDVAAAPDGTLVVADGDTLRRVTPAGVVTTIPLDGPDGKAVPYVQIFGVAVEPTGAIDLSTLHRIDRLGTDGVVRTLAGSDQAGYADGIGNLAAFNLPQRLAWDPQGYLVVADSGNNRIRRVNPDGSVTTIAGDGAAGLVDGAATSAEFDAPEGVAVESDGTILVADTGDSVVREIAAGKVQTLAGTGTPGLLDGPAALAQFGNVTSIAVQASGPIAIADPDNQRIRMLSVNK